MLGVSLGLLIVIAAVVVPVAVVSNSSVQVPSFAPVITTSQPSTATTAGKKAAPAPHAATSYLTLAGLRAGLAHIARLAPGARLTIVRVAADSLSADAALPHGRNKEIIFEPTGTFVVSGPSTGERPIPMSQIRPTAVTRIVAEMRRRFRVPANRIDYIVLSSPTGAPTQWITFTKAPSHPGFAASLDGTGLARLPG